MTRVLLVEDEGPKLRHVQTRLREELPAARIDVCRSVTSAMGFLEGVIPDLLILDMSLPTFDVSEQEGGGRPQGFGGVEVLRFIAFSDLACPVLVLTGYEAFPKGDGQVNLAELEAELAEEFPDLVLGVLRFNSSYDLWKTELHEAIVRLRGTGRIP